MLWIAVTVVLLMAMLVSGTTRVRIAIAALLVAVLVVGAVIRLTSEHEHTVQVTNRNPQAQVSPAVQVPVGSVIATDLTVGGNGAPWQFSGTLQNTLGAQTVRAVTFRITRSDCYPGALDPSGCVVLWQGETLVEQRVPPNEQRRFVTTFWSHGAVPRLKGQARDDIKVLAVSADR